ncbi:hypothetical protein R1flu_026906 [Riccia fluitans]|uniref:Uncharacterized protein n=1 Tax=Riccia fluitans TaxID=41844 RepID=A0ABD1XH93_9MARC
MRKRIQYPNLAGPQLREENGTPRGVFWLLKYFGAFKIEEDLVRLLEKHTKWVQMIMNNDYVGKDDVVFVVLTKTTSSLPT